MRKCIMNQYKKCFCLFILLLCTALVSGYAAQKPFEQTVSQALPLTGADIHILKDAVAERLNAQAQKPGTSEGKARSRTLLIDLDPSRPFSPPILTIGLDMITSIVMTDANGRIWPIKQITIADNAGFKVIWDQKSGTFMLQALKAYATSNMAVMLKGLDVPVMVTLLTGQKDWDYLDYLRVSTRSLSAADKVNITPPAPHYLVNLLSDIPPETAQVKTFTGANDLKIWQYQGHYLLLTSATLISPAWKSRVQNLGDSDMNAYEIEPTPLLILSNHQQIEHVTINN